MFINVIQIKSLGLWRDCATRRNEARRSPIYVSNMLRKIEISSFLVYNIEFNTVLAIFMLLTSVHPNEKKCIFISFNLSYYYICNMIDTNIRVGFNE